MCGQIAYDWKTMPRLRLCGATNTRAGTEATTRPRSAISPASGCSSPATRRRVVVLPQPLGPSSVKSSPRSTSSEAPSRARTAPKTLVTPSRRRTVTAPPSALPELSRRQARAFHARLDLRPRDLRVAAARPEAAARPRHHVLAPDEPRVLHEALGHQLGVLDEVAGVADDAGDEDLAGGELDVFPHAPLVVVARVRRLDGVALRAHGQDQVHELAQREVVLVRAVGAAPAHVEAHALPRNVAQRVIERLDPQRGEPPVVGPAHRRMYLPGVRQVGV